MIRTLTLILTLGLFLATSSANACDGDKAVAKGKKTAMKCADGSKCMKNGKCTMTAAEMKKSGCCSSHATTASSRISNESASANAAGTPVEAKSDAKANCDGKASGKHACCKSKTKS